jgi:hypothetical protein
MSRELVVIGVDDPQSSHDLQFAVERLAHDGQLRIDDALTTCEAVAPT